MFLKNYYDILDITPRASLDDVKRTYRQMAMKYHPDRGGSHARMIEINEAFEVLSDPKLRLEYDYARSNQNDSTAQENAAATAEDARQRAEDYPRKWSNFAAWMSDDFKEAKYGSFSKWGSMPLPTAGKSVTGWVFIIVGGIIGIVIASAIMDGVSRDGASPLWRRALGFLFAAIVAGCAFAGQIVHQAIGQGFGGSSRPDPTSKADSKPTEAPPLPVIVNCPKCSQKLRVSSSTRQIRITCSSCKYVFFHAPPDA